ncbi:MAG TPA: thiopurine S-methyltransferase [Wenzhouxiangella sp.]|nr:thiopurine S-methyltransferase [Wenzhouxiangella sp.]
MEKHFWKQRWQRGETGFHRDRTHPALAHHWDDISTGSCAPALVPLCGKSLDLRWLAQRGHDVVGVELSAGAIEAFYREWDKPATRTRAGRLQHWRAQNVEIFEGDFFDFESDTPFDLFYDRAALVALPEDMRTRYLDHLRRQLSAQATGLLITLEYDQTQMDGPPFSVVENELRSHPGFSFELLERSDALTDHPRFAERGLTALHECAWRVMVV